MANQVRVRYAPSPTGMQHIGGIRTALFNYFFARSSGGQFILRIEDTDQTRFAPDALRDIYETFDWLGLRPDEGPRAGGDRGPYTQSERVDVYRRYADTLVQNGNAYWDYSSGKQEGDETRRPYEYEGRDLTDKQISEYQERGVQPVLRLLVPTDGATEFTDLVLGRIKRKNKDVPPDPILMKSDGFPTYHLANVVDDHLMEISHVLRAQEWVPSTPLHLLLYNAFGWEPPQYAHLPMVMGKDGSKLSKRHGATSVIEFRNGGYLAEAITNYVTMLGWAFDDSREFFTLAELETLFAVERINKAPAVFDYKKLDWYNGQYIRSLEDDDLLARLLPYVQERNWISAEPTVAERERLASLLPLIRERLKKLSDVGELLAFTYRTVDAWSVDDLIPKNSVAADALRYLDEAWAVLKKTGLENEEKVDDALRDVASRLDTKLGNIMMPLRVAVTGSRISPPLVGSIRVLGLEETERRVAGARSVLQKEMN